MIKKPRSAKRAPWKYCKKCAVEIKSPTGYCHACYKGEGFTASPYGLVNTSLEFRLMPSNRSDR